MGILKLNETPVRTSRSFNINNIKLEDIDISNAIGSFNNVEIKGENSKILIEESETPSIKYGLGNDLLDQVKQQANKKLKLVVNSKSNKEMLIDFKFDKDNFELVDNIEIIANENTKSTIILRYESDNSKEYFHNGIINVNAKKNSHTNIIIVNLMNTKSNNFMSIQNKFEENSKIEYTVIDFGGKNSITNYYCNLLGTGSNSSINTIYLGKENQLFDLNYIGELRGEKTNIDIEVQGALKDNAKKHFKGTIDFKKGSKKAIGNENEFCMLLSDTARSIALPMLLCDEEDVEGNHSSAAGKANEKELFYIMSRGFSYKEAMKLIVRARFNKIIEKIPNEELKEQILEEIDKRLD